MKGKKIVVLGLAKSGFAVSKLLSQDNDVIVSANDDSDKMRIKALNDAGIKFVKSETSEELIDENVDLLVRNPGILPSHKAVKKATELGIMVTTEIEVAYHYLKEDVKIIGITGSNGKTTVTTMIYDILSRVMDNVHLAGNIGYPLSEVVPKVESGDIIVMEVSDHQLYDVVDFKTDISVLTNIYATHLDFHGNIENYKNVKKKIFNHHTKDNLAIINEKNIDSMDITKDLISKKEYFNGNDCYLKDEMIYLLNEPFISVRDIKLKGIHNYENIMALLLVLKEFNIPKEVIKEYLSTFGGVEHRIEFVCEKDNILFYNDSKSTNPTSTIVALKSFQEPVHLILGGFERSQDFNELNDHLQNVKCIYAIGEVTDRLSKWATEKNIPNLKCYSLKEAMFKINGSVSSGEVVLLSPASASWDQYDNFETRGNEFKKISCNLR